MCSISRTHTNNTIDGYNQATSTSNIIRVKVRARARAHDVKIKLNLERFEMNFDIIAI